MLNRFTPTAGDQPVLIEIAQPLSCEMLKNCQLNLSPLRLDAVSLKPIRRVARAKTAAVMIDCGRSHFFALQNAKDPAFDPTFPRPFKLGKSLRSPTVWFVDEIEAWLEARAAVSRKQH